MPGRTPYTGDLLTSLPPLRDVPEMIQHIEAMIRCFPDHEKADVVEELIDRAERRQACTPATASCLREIYAEADFTLA